MSHICFLDIARDKKYSGDKLSIGPNPKVNKSKIYLQKTDPDCG